MSPGPSFSDERTAGDDQPESQSSRVPVRRPVVGNEGGRTRPRCRLRGAGLVRRSPPAPARRTGRAPRCPKNGPMRFAPEGGASTLAPVDAEGAQRILRLEDEFRAFSTALRAFSEATTDYERLLHPIARTLGGKDGCVLRLLSEGGWLSPGCVPPPRGEPMRDADAVDRVRGPPRQLLTTSPSTPGLRHVLETGEAVLVPRPDLEALRATATREMVAVYETIGVDSHLLVALRARGVSIGSLAVFRFDRRPRPSTRATWTARRPSPIMRPWRLRTLGSSGRPCASSASGSSRGGTRSDGGAAPSSAEDGGRRAARRRRRARLQQPPLGDPQLRGDDHRRPQAGRSAPCRHGGDQQAGKRADGPHPAAPRVQPTAGARAEGARPEPTSLAGIERCCGACSARTSS